jgi:magnesium chelatase family protein
VQVQISSRAAGFITVGLPDEAVNESRERVQPALHAIDLAMPPHRIIVNLSPADLPKEGTTTTCRSHWGCSAPWG